MGAMTLIVAELHALVNSIGAVLFSITELSGCDSPIGMTRIETGASVFGAAFLIATV